MLGDLIDKLCIHQLTQDPISNVATFEPPNLCMIYPEWITPDIDNGVTAMELVDWCWFKSDTRAAVCLFASRVSRVIGLIQTEIDLIFLTCLTLGFGALHNVAFINIIYISVLMYIYYISEKHVPQFHATEKE